MIESHRHGLHIRTSKDNGAGTGWGGGVSYVTNIVIIHLHVLASSSDVYAVIAHLHT